MISEYEIASIIEENLKLACGGDRAALGRVFVLLDDSGHILSEDFHRRVVNAALRISEGYRRPCRSLESAVTTWI